MSDLRYLAEKFERARSLSQRDQAAEAAAICREILELQPAHVDSLILLGEIAARTGDADLALESYAKVIEFEPEHALAYYKRGNLLKDRDQMEAALASYDQAIALDPGYANAFCNRGVVLERLHRFEAALESYDQAIALNPGDSLAYFNRGSALRQLKRLEDAVASYNHAIAITRDYAECYCNRGILLSKLEQWDAALASYDQAIEINPGFFQAFCNRGTLLRDRKQWNAALDSYTRAIEINPDYAEAHCYRGVVLTDLRQWDGALASLNRAIALKPDFAEAYCCRGNLFAELNRDDAALADYDEAISLNPGYADAYCNRANALVHLKRFDSAVESYDRAIAIEPAHAGAFEGRGFCLLSIGQIEAAIVNYNRALALKPDGKYVFGMRRHAQMHICDWENLAQDLATITEGLTARTPIAMPFQVLALVDSAPLQRLAAEIWTSEKCPSDHALGPIPERPRSDKIKIGYYSSDFRPHPVAMLTAELFETHDRSKFEIIGFAFGPEANDPVRARLQRAFDRFIDVRHHSDVEVASLSRKIGIDVAVDLGGLTAHSRTNIFALRAAPIQLSYLGYLGTMGAPYMDYLVADATTIPADRRQDYSENIIYLPSYQVNDSHRRSSERTFTREELGLPPTGFVFSCFNANYKITPSTFQIWMKILKRVEGSMLFLYVDNQVAQRNLLMQALRDNVEARRIVFGERIPVGDYLARLRTMDLFLDTLPYNAGTTASDALWAGLPVLTCMGDAFAGRVAASLLTAIDLPELITASPQEYEELAVGLALNPARLDQIRKKLALNRLVKPLFNTPLFTKHLESAYTQIYGRLHAGLPPEHVYPQF